MEFTVSSVEELEEKLNENGYSNNEIRAIVEMYHDETEEETQTITVSSPR